MRTHLPEPQWSIGTRSDPSLGQGSADDLRHGSGTNVAADRGTVDDLTRRPWHQFTPPVYPVPLLAEVDS